MLFTNQEIRAQLQDWAEPQYLQFSAGLTPGANMLGVRMPQLRKLAKQICSADWQAYLAEAWDEYHEEKMLQGLVLGHAKADLTTLLPYVQAFIPKIDNWAINDSFCAAFHQAKQDLPQMLAFIKLYLSAAGEFEVRMAVIMLMNYFLSEEYLPQVFSLLATVQHNAYYVEMAIAWTVATAYAKFPAQSHAFLQQNRLSPSAHNKAIQKARESRRISDADKQALLSLKRSTAPAS